MIAVLGWGSDGGEYKQLWSRKAGVRAVENQQFRAKGVKSQAGKGYVREAPSPTRFSPGRRGVTDQPLAANQWLKRNSLVLMSAQVMSSKATFGLSL